MSPFYIQVSKWKTTWQAASVHVSYNIGKVLLQIWDQKHVPQIIVALEYIQVAMKKPGVGLQGKQAGCDSDTMDG